MPIINVHKTLVATLAKYGRTIDEVVEIFTENMTDRNIITGRFDRALESSRGYHTTQGGTWTIFIHCPTKLPRSMDFLDSMGIRGGILVTRGYMWTGSHSNSSRR